MMNYIKIEKDIFMRDRLGVKIAQWLAGQLVPAYVYHAVVKSNTILNPEDLPVEPVDRGTASLNTQMMETKVLPEEPVVEEVAEEPTPKPKAKAGKKKAKK